MLDATAIVWDLPLLRLHESTVTLISITHNEITLEQQ